MNKVAFLIITLLFFIRMSYSQNIKQTLINNEWKYSRRIPENERSLNKKYVFNIQFKDSLSFNAFVKKNNTPFEEISRQFNIITIESHLSQMERIFTNDNNVVYINVTANKPKEELAVKGFDLTANKVNAVQNKFPAINGNGQTVSIKENNYDTSDIDLKGRIIYSPVASKQVTNHANFMATIIAGADNSIYYSKGAAWGANLSSSSFDQILPDANSYYDTYKITVQNHSYGTDIDNNYGLNASAFDISLNQNPNLIHVFSSGNSGNLTSSAGKYSGIPGYANLTGNFKMSKNSMVVGGVDSFGVLSSLSSTGPAYDGRIKPEITAFQMNGTSESAALVSGTILLLQQYYKSIHKTDLPSPLAKAIIINSADDIGAPGPDYKTGFGNLNALKAMNEIENNTLFNGMSSKGSVKQFQISVPDNVAKLKVTLCWNDSAAKPSSVKALTNDLDVFLTSAVLSDTIRPWVLNPYPNIDSLSALPQRKRDSLNNVEQITLDTPPGGTYFINVSGYSLPFGAVPFYISYSIDTLRSFKWLSPGKNDFVEAGKSVPCRWENIGNSFGDIEFSFDGKNTWSKIASNQNLSNNYFQFSTPDTVTKGQLRMKIGNNFYYSDTFQISRLVSPQVGFICGDSILIEWNRVKDYNNFVLCTPDNRYMVPFKEVNDTAIILSKGALNGHYISVAGKANDGSIGTRSYALDYTTQASGCFINSFIATLNTTGTNGSNLILELGTTFNIRNISFEKFKEGSFSEVFTSTVTGLSYTYFDSPIKTGITYYRAKIILNNGRIIYSDRVPVFFASPGEYIVFPIPVSKNNDLQILTSTPNEESFIIRDMLGRIVMTKTIQSARQVIPTGEMRTGIYFYQIIKNDALLKSGKLIVQ